MAVPASALIENHPEGIFKFVNAVMYERGTYRVRFRVLQAGEPVDFTGCTVDYAQVDSTVDGYLLISLTVTLGNDGWVTISGNNAQMTESLVSINAYPDGRPAVMTVRLKDPSGSPFYLVAPSEVLIKHSPGSNT